MNITSKGNIEPTPIEKEAGEMFSLFIDRNNLHESISGFKVYINQYAWDAFLNHCTNVYKQTKHEAQGIFLGKYFKDKFGNFAVATEYSEGVGESSHAYVGMAEECVAEISKKCFAENLLMLIWIHTHPDFGVFYSSTDVNCLKTNFHMPFQSGIVVDIIRRESKGFKVDNKNVNEFSGYYIYSVKEKRLSKPYAVKVEPKGIDIKKNESPKNTEFPTKEIFNEFQLIKKELVELKSIADNNQEKPKLQPQIDSFEEHKEYFDTNFREIKQQLNSQKDYIEHLEHIIPAQEKFKKILLWLLIGLSVVFGLGVITFTYLLIKSLFRN